VTRPSLRALQVRLTLWYGGTFAVILALLGVGLFAAIHRQITMQAQRALEDSAAALIRAADIREMEAAEAQGTVVDAIEELHIPHHRLYLLDGNARPVTPTTASGAIRAGARQAIRSGSAEGEEHRSERETESGERRFYAQRFTSRGGATMVAVVSGDVVEVQERYSALIVAFSAAAVVALVLVAAGGWLLVRQSTAPIERNLLRMRQFMADAAHELRSPVTVVRTRAEVALQQPREADEYAATLRGIEAESSRMASLVDDLLILARADGGERPVERRRLFLDDVVLDAAEAARTMAATRGVAVDLDQYEETAVDGDAALLRQLVMILLDNAVKYTPAGGRVTVRVGQADGVPRLVIQDSGRGIRPDQLPHVFERFYRGDPARTAHPGDGGSAGAGLGLAIAKWIGDAHRARIHLTSVEGAGTTVAVVFPRPKEG